MRKILTAAASLAMLMSSAGPALAGIDGHRAWNKDTGYNSVNKATVEDHRGAAVVNVGIALGYTDATGSADTSGNSATGNNGDTKVISNTADSGSEVLSDANNVDTTVTDGPSAPAEAYNEDTGAESDNTAKVTEDNETLVVNGGLAMTATTADSTATSGDNIANGNDGKTEVNAGSAISRSKSVSMVNWSTTRITR